MAMYDEQLTTGEKKTLVLSLNLLF